MAGTCDRIVNNAPLGKHVLKVSSADSDVVVGGARSVNEVEVETWTHDQLFNVPKEFTVKKGERHQLLVFGTFPARSTATVTVVVTKNDVPVAPACTLTRKGNTMAAIEVLAAL